MISIPMMVIQSSPPAAVKRIVVEPSTWKIDEGGHERASLTQVPLRLALAMTVHKSQGMSLEPP